MYNNYYNSKVALKHNFNTGLNYPSLKDTGIFIKSLDLADYLCKIINTVCTYY